MSSSHSNPKLFASTTPPSTPSTPHLTTPAAPLGHTSFSSPPSSFTRPLQVATGAPFSAYRDPRSPGSSRSTTSDDSSSSSQSWAMRRGLSQHPSDSPSASKVRHARVSPSFRASPYPHLPCRLLSLCRRGDTRGSKRRRSGRPKPRTARPTRNQAIRASAARPGPCLASSMEVVVSRGHCGFSEAP